MLIVLKVLLQLVTVVSAIVSSSLDYKWHDKRTRTFKTGRAILFTLTGVLLLLSIGVTIVDDYQIEKKEQQLNADLKKVQAQNDGLQQSIKVLGIQSSDLLQKQEGGLVSLLEDQRTLNDQTGHKIEAASDLLKSNISETITQTRATLANITGGDSFCYIDPDARDDTLTLDLRSKGGFPLYDVVITVEDLNDGKNSSYEASSISTMQNKTLGQLPLQSLTKKSLEIKLQTRYAIFREDVRLVKTGDGWLAAFRVLKTDTVEPERITENYEKPFAKPTPHPPISGGILSELKYLLISIDYAFPRDKQGFVDWYDYK